MGASFWSVEVISSLRGRFLHRVSPWLWDPLGLGAELSIKYTCVFQIPWFCGTATENSFFSKDVCLTLVTILGTLVACFKVSCEDICDTGKKMHFVSWISLIVIFPPLNLFFHPLASSSCWP